MDRRVPKRELRPQVLPFFENIRERGHPAHISGHNSTHGAGRMPALPDFSSFPDAHQPAGMSDCSEFFILKCKPAKHKRKSCLLFVK